MRNLTVLQGLPASGKSTWAKKIIERHKDVGQGAVRVNRDLLREMLTFSDWTPEFEEKVIAIEVMIASYFLNEDGYGVVIVDDVNLGEKAVKMWTEIAKTHKVNVQFNQTNVGVEECIRRDKKRKNSVGEKVIRKFAKLNKT